MKTIRRFFTYVITLVIILLLAYGYVYWGNLFGDDSPARQLVSWMQAEDSPVTETPEPLLPEVEEPVVEIAPEQEVEIEEFVDEAAVPVAEVPLNESTATELMPLESVQDETPLAVDMPAAALVAEDIHDEDNLSAQSSSLAELWKQARHSFHYRDFQTSVDSYQELIALTQDNFDAYEELGDVYAYYGKNREAASAYYEAASTLVRLGKLERAADFMKPLSLMDASKARALLDQLESAK